MDFVRALTFPFDDNEWLKKLGIATLIQFIPILGQIVLQGWSVEISQRVKRGSPEPLPGWDQFSEYIGKGFTVFIANLIYQIPTVIFACLASFSWILPAMGAGSDGEGFLAALGVGAVVCLSCVIFLYAIAAAIVFFGGYVRYIDNPQLGVFFQFGDNIALVRNNIGEFGMAILYVLLAGLIVGAISGITAGIGSILATPFIMYVMGHILGQLATRLSANLRPAV